MGSLSRAFALGTLLCLTAIACDEQPSAVPSDGNDSGGAGPTDALTIVAFSGQPAWGDAPLATSLAWTIAGGDGRLRCELDADGDGMFEVVDADCSPKGSRAVILPKPGRVDASLRVTSGSSTTTAKTVLFVNKVDWVPNLIRVRSLPGLVSSDLKEDGTVTLTLASAASVPSVSPGVLLWDEASGGFVREVKTAKVTGSTVVAATVPRSILDIASGGFWGRTEDGQETGQKPLTLTLTDCNVTSLPPTWSVQSFGVPELAVKSGNGKDAVAWKDGRVLVGMSSPNVVYDFWAGIFSALVTIEVRSCGNLSASMKGDLLDLLGKHEWVLPGALGGELDFGFFKTSAGFVPRGGISLEGTVGVELPLMVGGRMTAYMSFTKTSLPDAKIILAPKSTHGNLTATLEGVAKVYLKPSIELIWGHPQKKCEAKQTVNNGAFKLGVDVEVGARAKLEGTFDTSGKATGCFSADWYGEVTAQAIPPLTVIDCAELNADLFEVPIFPKQCLSGGGGAGGAGTGGAGAGGLGVGGSGAGGKSGQGGSTSAGSGGTGGAGGTGGTIVVSSLSPTTATVGTSTTFTVSGAGLPSSLQLSIPQCTTSTSTTGGSTTRSLVCTPGSPGNVNAQVLEAPGGKLLGSFAVFFKAGTVNPSVSVTPASGPQGTTFQEPGVGFTPNGAVTLHFKQPNGTEAATVPVTAGATGAFSHAFTSSASTMTGTWSYWAVDGATGASTPTVAFTITGGMSVNPQVSVSPSSGAQGTTFQEPGTGFTPGGPVTLHFKQPNGSETPVASATADASGAFAHSYASTASTALGTWSYWAVDNITGKSSPAVAFTVTAGTSVNPKVSVSPSSGVQGTTFQEPGSGFTPFGAVTLHFKQPNGVEAPVVGVTANGSGAFTHAYASSSGTMVGSWTYWGVDNTSGISSPSVGFTVMAADAPPSVAGASLPGSVQVPGKLYFSGTATDDVGLSTITMLVSGPKGSNIQAFSDATVSGTSKALTAYYFDSANSAYAGVAGTYTVALWAKDSSTQTSSKTFTVNVTASDAPPSLTTAALPSSVTRPAKIYFSGTATDDIGLTTITMMVSGPKGTNIQAFTDAAVSGTSKGLSAYYFDSANASYANLAGSYTVALWAKDTAGQVISKTFPVTVLLGGGARRREVTMVSRGGRQAS